VDYKIRPAQAEDLASLPAIEHAASQLFRETPYPRMAAGSYPDVQTFVDWFRDGAIWVAERDGTLVGFAAAEEIDGEGFLAELNVVPEHGRQGLGAQLIQAVKDWGAARGFSAVRLATMADIAWNAPYYARLGFRVMDETELTAGLLEVRREEAEGGVEMLHRVFMTAPCR
jgi:GNAT superfamily N-acetyltransferase